MMDAQEQRDAIVGMQRDMHHLLEAVRKIQAEMVTEKDLVLLAKKAEVDAAIAMLTNRLDNLERDVREKSPGALWRTTTSLATGLVVIVAAVAALIKWAKGMP